MADFSEVIDVAGVPEVDDDDVHQQHEMNQAVDQETFPGHNGVHDHDDVGQEDDDDGQEEEEEEDVVDQQHHGVFVQDHLLGQEHELVHNHELGQQQGDVYYEHEGYEDTQALDNSQVIDNNTDHQVKEEEEEAEEQHHEVAVSGGAEKKWPGWPGESVFRMLVPAQKVGSIIGRKGEFIKKIVEETRARIKILDGPPGTSERAVMVSAKDEPDSAVPPAVDGLLRVHKRIIDGMEGDSSHAPLTKISTRFLVPASQAGSLIGKQGATVKSIQEASSCIVRVLGSEDLPVFALQDDRVVEVVGDPTAVHRAVEMIGSHLRKFLVDHSIISVFEKSMKMAPPPMDHMPPPHQSWGPPQGMPPNAGVGGPGYGHTPQYMPPPRQLDNYYPPAEMAPPPMEKQPHQGISAYGREAPIGGHPSANQQAPSMITQVTQQMQIPLSCADAVIGNAGSSISYIRRASGATVTIQETRGVPGEMTVEISGTASQVQTAQQLIQISMSEAANAQTQAVSAAEQGYNPYAAHATMYSSPPANQGHGGHAGGYGSVYALSFLSIHVVWNSLHMHSVVFLGGACFYRSEPFDLGNGISIRKETGISSLTDSQDFSLASIYSYTWKPPYVIKYQKNPFARQAIEFWLV
ncbi:hypothetical protein ACFE04_024867 [Oxalis oulophora]